MDRDMLKLIVSLCLIGACGFGMLTVFGYPYMILWYLCLGVGFVSVYLYWKESGK